MKKELITLIILSLLILSTGYAVLTFQNNREASWPERAQIQGAFDASIGWIETHQEEILRQSNPVLWWMIQHSATLTGNSVLHSVFDRYQHQYLNTTRDLWQPLFFPGRWVPFKSEDIKHFNDSQKFFIYAISCDPDLGQQPNITEQLNPDYCDHNPFIQACAANQLMAFRFMQQNRCGDAQASQAAVTALQARIALRLTWDPRVVEVYLQRVLTLAQSGATAKIKPIWLQRVLDAQLPDGGWDGFDPYLEFPTGDSLGFDGRGFALTKPESDFQATAHGVFIMSLMLNSTSGAPQE